MENSDIIVVLFAMCIAGLFIVIGLLVWYIIEIRKLRKSINAYNENRQEDRRETDGWKPKGWEPENWDTDYEDS